MDENPNASENAQSILRSLAEATGRTPEEVDEFVESVMKFQDAIDSEPIVYTNRAARRVRARAERKN